MVGVRDTIRAAAGGARLRVRQAIMLPDKAVEAIGVFAVLPGRAGWIDADEINEEVVDADYAGHGYAASAQRTWASRPANRGGRMLVGTVDRLNVVSRRTAERAGRPRVLEDVFLLLP